MKISQHFMKLRRTKQSVPVFSATLYKIIHYLLIRPMIILAGLGDGSGIT